MQLNDFAFRFAETWVYVFVDMATECSVEDTMEVLLGNVDFMNLSMRVNTRAMRSYANRSLAAYGKALGERAGTCAIGSLALLAGNALVEFAAGSRNPSSTLSMLSAALGKNLVSSFVWWRSTNAYHTYVFTRLVPTRVLEWMARKMVPRPVRLFVQQAFGIGSDPAVRAEYYKMLEETGANYGQHVAQQGPFASVLHNNLIAYASTFIIDQCWWTYLYCKERNTWRRVAKAHAMSTTIMVSEIVMGLALRYTGAKIGHTVFPRPNGMGAFFGENIVHWAGGFFAAKLIRKLVKRVHIGMDNLLPASVADIEADAVEQEEMHQQEEEWREKMNSEFVADEENFYKVLDVKTDASEDEIRKQYRKLALSLHPDKLSGLPEAEREEKAATFKKVSHAYSVLTNSEKRSLYDKASRTPAPPDFIAKLAARGRFERSAVLAGLATALFYVGGSGCYMQILTVVRMLGSPGNTGIRTWVMMSPFVEPQY